MNKYFTLVSLLFILLPPNISKADKLSPKQVIERYYELIMNSCWCCNARKPDVACRGNPLMLMLHTKKFNTNFSLDASLYPSLPLKISNCKEEKNKASCDVTYFIIGEWNWYDPFCEQHNVKTATLNLFKDSGVWKISSKVEPGEGEISGDDSNVVSIPYILKRIDEYMKYDREHLENSELQKKDFEELWVKQGIYKNKEEWLKHMKEDLIKFEKDKQAIKEIESKALKYGLINGEVFVKDLACQKPNPEIIKELKGNK